MTFGGVILEYLYAIPLWVVITLGLVTIIYEYLTWHFGYWESQGVKALKPWPLLGTLASPFKNKARDVQYAKAYLTHGRIVGLYQGRIPTLMVGDPDLLKNIFVKDFHAFQNRTFFESSQKKDFASKMLFFMQGDEWKELRTIISPTFTTGKLKPMVSLINECAQQMVKHLTKLAESGRSFEARQPFASYTLDVIARCAFGTKIDSVQDHNSKFVQTAQKGFGEPPRILFLFLILPAVLRKIIARFIPTAVFEYLDEIVLSVIETRKNGHNQQRDLLQLLLEAKEENENKVDDDADQDRKDKTAIRKSVLTTDHISAQAILFLLAGYETSTITLSFALYHLALHEDVQDKLIQEVDKILVQKHKNVFTYEVMAEMEYLDMVISETLRMCPPSGSIDRVCNEDGYNLHGIILKKGVTIAIPIYSIHHDPEFYPNPENFDPERFTKKNRQDRNPYTYLPFGHGPRNCIGLRFAMMQIKTGLVYLLKEFRVKTAPDTQIPFVRKPGTIFYQPVSTILRLEKRI